MCEDRMTEDRRPRTDDRGPSGAGPVAGGFEETNRRSLGIDADLRWLLSPSTGGRWST